MPPPPDPDVSSGTTRLQPPTPAPDAPTLTQQRPPDGPPAPLPSDPGDGAADRLRERLLVLDALLALVFAGLASVGWAWTYSPDPTFSHMGTQMVRVQGLCALVLAGSAAYLALGRPGPADLVRGQWLTFVTVSAFCVWFQVTKMYDNDDGLLGRVVEMHPLFAACAFNFGWLAFLVSYGTFLTHDWRRLAAQAAAVVLTPVAVCLGVAAFDPPTGRPYLGSFAVASVVFLAFGAAVVVFASYQENRLRRDVVEARRVGPYRLGEKLGEGGMGVVYRAEHRLVKRPCAIKFIRPEVVADPARRQRFFREFQAMARLSHWNLVEVYDYGRAADGSVYYVMEFLGGPSLDQLVRRHGPVPAARAVHLLRQIASALRQAHALGLVHRDVKPSNVLVTERGGTRDVVKVLDFGLVQDAGHALDAHTLTGAGVVMGTPGYMAPEQAAGSPDVDARADLYALGAVGHFLLTGRAPFAGRFADIIAAQLAGPEVALDPAVAPEDVREVLGRCLRRDPAGRYADADELLAALDGVGCARDWSAAAAEAWWAAAGPGPAPETRTPGGTARRASSTA